MAELKFRLVIDNGQAKATLSDTEGKTQEVKSKIESPSVFNVNAQNALGTIRDVMFNLDSLKNVLSSIVSGINDFLNSSLQQKQAVKLTNIAFGEQSKEIQNLASQIQSMTNYGDEQLLPLMSKLAQTYKLTTEEVKLLSPLLVDFAEANASTGMTITTAFDLMGRAMTGHTEMLGRYGLELDKTKLKEEGVSYLAQKLSEDYGGVATSLADLRLQNANTWGDIKEQIGDMLNVLVTPLLKGIKSLFEWYKKLTPTVKGFVTGLALAIPVIGSVTTTIIILTTAIIALKTAINPVVGIIGLVVTALATVGFGYASYKLSVDSAKNAQTTFNDELQTSEERLQSLIVSNRELANSMEYSEAKEQLKSVGEEIDNLLQKYNANRDTKILFIPDQAEIDKLNELYVKEGTLKEKIRIDDLKAQEKWLLDKNKMEKEASLSSVELTAYKLSEARKLYNELGNIDNENYEQKKEVYSKILELESKLSQQVESETDKRLLLQQKYSVLAINDAVQRQIKQLEIERDSELKKAQSIGANEETIANIKTHYANEIQNVLDKNREQEEAKRQADLEKQKQLEAEKQAILYDFERLRQQNLERTIDSELNAVEQFYSKKKSKLLSAGISEEQITKQTEASKERIRAVYRQKAVTGFSTMFGNIAKTASAFGKKGFVLWKAMSISQAIMDTYASANAAYKAMAGLPVIGPALGIAAATAAIGAGLANVAMISKQKPPEAELGGLLVGNSHSQGGILIEAEGDEYITRKSRVRELGTNFFDFVNNAPLGEVKRVLSNLTIPKIPLPTTVGASYGNGGQISSGFSFKAFVDEIKELKNEVINLQNEVRIKELSVHNHISANSIIEKADSSLISEKSETGSLIRSTI